MSPPLRFANYPIPEEGQETAYESPFSSNPTLRGYPLAVGAGLVTRLSLLQQVLWGATGFGKVKNTDALDEVSPRFDPCVIPLGDSSPMLEFEPSLLKNKYADSSARYYTASDYHEMYKSGRVTPLQVVEALLPLTKSGQYADAWAEGHGEDHLAISAAKASTERYAAGKPLGVLDGVPIGVKDDTDVEGYTNHKGLKYNKAMPCFKVQDTTAWPVLKLQEAGAIVIGKNSMHEFGADTSGCNTAQGTATNHFNKSYYPGGSSSGGGSAVGAGVVPLMVGTDAGGSVRMPSAYNGVYGLKPSHHRTMHMGMSMCVTGPAAASVADLTIAYRVMSQPNPDCSTQSQFGLSHPPAPGAKRVMGICREWFNQADAEVVKVCNKALDYFEHTLGYEIVDISIPHYQEARIAHLLISVTELSEIAHKYLGKGSNWLSSVSYGNQIVFSTAVKTPAVDYIACHAMREVMMRHLAFLYKKYPGLIIMTPTSPLSGWLRNPADEWGGMSDTDTSRRNVMYVFLANLTGTPALTAPVGYADVEHGDGKMPVGLMAMGEWGSEEQLLAWGAEAEKYLNEVYEGGRMRPKTWLDVLDAAADKAEE